MNGKSQTSVIAAGLALFSMFFGAGDLIWPLILGGDSGTMAIWTISGFMITAVTLPLLGLIAMMLYMGDYYTFFGRIGKIPAFIIIFIIQAIVGPVGSIPRLYTLAHATLQPYMPVEMGLLAFSVFASGVVLLFTLKKKRIVDVLGMVLSPLLLLAMAMLVVVGLINAPAAPDSYMVPAEAFQLGLGKGYNTLDLIASFIFAPLVLGYFCDDAEGAASESARKVVAKRMAQASCLAAGLLAVMYLALGFIAAYYVPLLPAETANEGRLSQIALYLLGPYGGLASCVIVTLACLTTAIPLTSIAADYLGKDLLKDRIGAVTPLLLVLLVSGAIANLGFMGIADMLEPVLKILCPGLIVLCLLNIGERLYSMPVRRAPVFVTFGLSLARALFV